MSLRHPTGGGDADRNNCRSRNYWNAECFGPNLQSSVRVGPTNYVSNPDVFNYLNLGLLCEWCAYAYARVCVQHITCECSHELYYLNITNSTSLSWKAICIYVCVCVCACLYSALYEWVFPRTLSSQNHELYLALVEHHMHVYVSAYARGWTRVTAKSLLLNPSKRIRKNSKWQQHKPNILPPKNGEIALETPRTLLLPVLVV